MPKSKSKKKIKGVRTGKLRIADHWNAISIIAKSQANPLKAVAEFVENSIDAGAKQIVIVRGKKKGEFYLKISDDGAGIPRNNDGLPDFRRVATHICDSIKRQFKSERSSGIQGEFGIGLLSFWTVGHNLYMTSCGADGKTYEMTMAKDSPNFAVTKKRVLLPFKGTDLMIYPLLPGLRSLTGEKIQRYLASELRDRIKSAEVTVKVVDRTGRKELIVVPRQFSGRLLHNLNPAETEHGDIYLELYLSDPGVSNQVGLYRRGTRVLPSITELEQFKREPWTAGYLQGIVDVPFLNLTPGTRQGILRDDKFSTFREAMKPIESHLQQMIEDQRKAEEERSSRRILRRVQRALKEAFLRLPEEEYDWFNIHGGQAPKKPGNLFTSGPVSGSPRGKDDPENHDANDQKDGDGHLQDNHTESVTFLAPSEPCLTTLRVIVHQDDLECRDEALITVTDSLLDQSSRDAGLRKGLPGYSYRRAPGEMWRSRYDVDKNVIIINNGHRDFVYAGKQKRRKLRYICRLFCKELVRHNFPGMQVDELLERMIELSLYTEEHLK